MTTTKSKGKKRLPSALKKWKEACKKHGYPKKVGSKMRVCPKKGTAEYRKVRKTYEAMK